MNHKFLQQAFIRVPAYPIDFYTRLFEDEPAALAALQHDKLFMNALYLASPQLHHSFKTIEESALFSDSKKARKLRHSIIKYAIRISTRSTPFGLFAGSAVVHIAERTSLQVGEMGAASQRSRMDIQYLFFLVKQIATLPFVSPYLTYSVNTSLYKLGEHYRYIECHYVHQKRKFELVSVTANQYITHVVNFVGENPGSPADTIVGQLAPFNISREDGDGFIRQLIDAQMLVDNLELATTGDEMMEQLISALEQIRESPVPADHAPALNALLEQLYQINDVLREIDEAPVGDKLPHYGKLKTLAEALNNSLAEKYFIQTDMVIPFSSAEISDSLLPDLEKALDIIQRFTIPGKNKLLEKFIKAFEFRYESRSVPLVEALDIESGIGYGKYLEQSNGDFAPMVDDLKFTPAASGEESTIHSKSTAFWVRKISECIATRRDFIELTDADIEEFTPNPGRLTATYAMLTTLYKDRDGQPLIHVRGASGPTAATWLGRFSNADQKIKDLVQDIADLETIAHQDKIVAEITHLPDARIGNVVQRPAIRRYEIPYLAKSGVDHPHQLNINDLMLCVKSGKLYLFSKKHNRQVMPYITNAHYYGNGMNLPLYHFLGDMQELHGKDSSRIDTKHVQAFFPHIPRITYKNLILKRAVWQFKREEFGHLLQSDESSLVADFADFSRKYNIPRYFCIAHSDNELLIDGTNLTTLLIMRSEISHLSTLNISESLLNDLKPLVHNAAGESYHNETLFVIARTPDPTPARTRDFTVFESAKREFMPGSRWAYFNLYTGFKNADRILEQVAPRMQACREQGVIDKWFFIRYHDPRLHIRLRAELSESGNIQQLLDHLSPLFEKLQQDKSLWKLTLDTYKREVERYGEKTIGLLETMFYHDSEMCVSLIDELEQTGQENTKWLAALYAGNSFFDLFGFDQKERQQYASRAGTLFAKEFNASKNDLLIIDRKFRRHGKPVYDILNGRSREVLGDTVVNIIERRNVALRPIIGQLFALEANAKTFFIDSLIHMSINRLFRSRQRVYEYIIYDFLARTYASSIARQAGSGKPEVKVAQS